MADRLARLFGTEEDKVNCSFFFKIGACRHADKCTRTHYRPPISQTLLIPHMYDNPPAALAMAEGREIPREAQKEVQKLFEEFYEDIFLEMSNFGEIEDIVVCDNIGDHLIGNVYVKFVYDEDAKQCKDGLTGRYYGGKLIIPEFSPVSDFKEARCRQFDDGECNRGGYCNFMHAKYLSRSFKKKLFDLMFEEHPDFRKKKRRSKSIDRRRNQKSRSRGRDKDRGGDRRKKRSSERKESGDEHQRMTSAERRAMIEQWNEDENTENQQ